MVNKLKFLNDDLINKITPLLLTSICRNPNSKFFGSCDRNWWHYKIRDFPSLILQQAGYSLFLIDEEDLLRSGISSQERNSIVDGVVNFWLNRTQLKGYAEEYYPYEDGYPPLAFGTLAMAKIVLKRKSNFNQQKLELAFSTSAKKLMNRFESKAGNQQVAGLAALFYIRSLFPNLISADKLNNLLERTLNLQHEEGWFYEYDGADLGYLSVSLDCLYDIYDCTKNVLVLNSIKNCIKFCATLLTDKNVCLSSLNSRNTDYLVPFGFVRGMMENSPSINKYSAYVLDVISSKHILRSVDERYWCHYIGHSVIRAFNLIKNNSFKTIKNFSKFRNPSSFPGAGIYKLQLKDKSKVVISSFKGGVINIVKDTGETVIDFGWTIEINNKKYTSYWFSREFEVFKSKNSINIKGYMYPVVEFESTPFKHFILRFLSFFFGRSIISHMKNKMIYRKKSRLVTFNRIISKKNNGLEISDYIKLNDKMKIFSSEPKREKQFSYRHVASAGGFVPVTYLHDSKLKLDISTRNLRNSYEIVSQVDMGENF